MTAMDALTAFRTFCQPMTGADAAQLRTEREQAQALHGLARACTHDLRIRGLNDGDRLSAISTVLMRIRTVGPRGLRPDDPETESQLRWYLRRAVKSEMLTRLEENSGLFKVAESLDGDLEDRRPLQVAANTPTPLQCLLAVEREQLASDFYDQTGELLERAIALTTETKRRKGRRWGDEFAKVIVVFLRVAAGDLTLVELARQRVAGSPRALTPSVVSNCAKAGWIWQRRHVDWLRECGLVIAIDLDEVAWNPDGAGVGSSDRDALWRAVVAAAEADERVALDRRFTNYRHAVLAEIDAQQAAGAFSPVEASLARHGVDHFLFIQPRTAV